MKIWVKLSNAYPILVRDPEIINQITSEIESVSNVKLLDVDMGWYE